jgi:hypothetical protein
MDRSELSPEVFLRAALIEGYVEFLKVGFSKNFQRFVGSWVGCVCVCARGISSQRRVGGGLGLNGRRQQKWRPHEGTTSTKSTWIRGFSCDGTMLLELVWMGRFLSMYLLSIHYTLVSWTLNVLLIQYARGSTLQIIQTQSWRQILWPD